MKKHVQYVFITGGVVSSLGKGVTSASLARLLKSREAPYPIFVGLAAATLARRNG